MLVGFFIVTDAKLKTFENYGRTGSGIANAPALPTGGALERLNTMLSTVTAVQRTSDHDIGRMSLLESAGEQIVGVCYRKVKFRRLFSRDVGLPSLGEKTRWKALWGWRGPKVNEEASDDDDDYGTDIEDDEEERGMGDLIEVSLENGSKSEYGDQDVSPNQGDDSGKDSSPPDQAVTLSHSIPVSKENPQGLSSNPEDRTDASDPNISIATA
jgi:hypothetical protein